MVKCDFCMEVWILKGASAVGWSLFCHLARNLNWVELNKEM